MKLYNDLSIELTKRSVGPMINTFVMQGLRGSYNHGIAVLEMAGAYKKTTKQEISAPGGELLPATIQPICIYIPDNNRDSRNGGGRDGGRSPAN